MEQEEPPVELQEVEEGGPKETPQELEGCAWETHNGDGMAEQKKTGVTGGGIANPP